MNQSTQSQQEKEDRFIRTTIIACIAVPIIIWILYTGYEKNQQSAPRTAACEKKCMEQGHNGFEFKWSMFGGPKCTCIDFK